MDDNGNARNNRSDDGEWDRWNSNASHSSYYNQPVHRPYGVGFSYASFLLGLWSITMCCCGAFCIIAVPVAALGILFALLVYRKGKKLNSIAKSGIILSCTGIVISILLFLYYMIAAPLLLQRLQQISQTQSEFTSEYGSDAYTEFFNRYYDYLMNNYGFPEQK